MNAYQTNRMSATPGDASLPKQSFNLSHRRNQSSSFNKIAPMQCAHSDHTFLSADGVRVSFVTAKQTELEILEFERQKELERESKPQQKSLLKKKTLSRTPKVYQSKEDMETLNNLTASNAHLRRQPSLSLCNELLEKLDSNGASNTESDPKQSQLKQELKAEASAEQI